MGKNDTIISNTYSLSQRASSLRLMSRSISSCLFAGSFRSMYKGRGVDYAGAREYLFGDDIRTIDWNVTARMGRPYIKLFEEDKELILFLIVDRSISMESGIGRYTRLEAACEAAVLMLFAAMQNSSPVGALLFDGEIEFVSSPKVGQDHAMLLFKKIDTRAKHSKAGTYLSQSLRYATKILKNRSLVIVLSDFRCGDYKNDIATLAAKHDVIALRISDESDVSLPDIGSVEFFDSETNTKKVFPTSNRNFSKEWKAYNQRHLERWQNMSAKRGVDTLTISTNEDIAHALAQFFAARRYM